ncbi:PTS system glucose-specific IIA component [Cytobacillus eiseniae]|uniref:PTS system glucose-specific IIA component n=1 Tax=Cytobacillus eiseniae TaxID=762947 RepID=A0ABS4RGY6_9BACI|nr:PTS glucose transporter subunit IIA [Cytobacillus eiseniae]MBP2242155.1 PTS system glucose-specific IIA component [Cytobacillus eiseniae]
MLRKFFKKEALQIISPLKGDVRSLEEVPDPVFSERLMGEGVAIMPDGGNVCSPIDGTVILVAETKHAIGLRSKDGTEVLIHIGLETVSLQGRGFRMLVENGDPVSVGQELIEVDWEFIRDKAKSLITPIIITNSKEKKVQVKQVIENVVGKTVVMTVSNK